MSTHLYTYHGRNAKLPKWEQQKARSQRQQKKAPSLVLLRPRPVQSLDRRISRRRGPGEKRACEKLRTSLEPASARRRANLLASHSFRVPGDFAAVTAPCSLACSDLSEDQELWLLQLPLSVSTLCSASHTVEALLVIQFCSRFRCG